MQNIGILGGGQLGRMVIQEAISYAIPIHILDSDPQAPCSQIASSFTNGSITDYETVLKFGSNKDVISVEIENVNIEALEELQRRGKKVFPQPHALRIIKDKGLQKLFLSEHNFPTAEFILVNNLEDLASKGDFLPGVNKLRTGGYDGKGVVLLNTKHDLLKGFDEPGILEKKIDFEKELSVIVARNAQGETRTYPAVECEFSQELNLVEFLFSPANISQKVEKNAQKIAVDIIERLDMVGLLAVEFFLLKDESLLVNEIAPRPHNSGHHTIECNFCSQFEQYLRAILGLPLGNTDAFLPGVMINLIGSEGGGRAKVVGFEQALSKSGVFVHLYGKTETKPHRKMGHITVANPDLAKAKTIARQLMKTVRIVAHHAEH